MNPRSSVPPAHGALAPTAAMQVWTAIRDVCTRAHCFLSCYRRTGTYPEESLKKGGNARHKYIACTFCLRALSGAISRVLTSTIATAAAMAGGVAGSANNTFSTTVHEPRDRSSLPTVADAHSGVSLDLLTEMEGTCDTQWNSGQSRSKRHCLPDSQTCSVSCGNLVDVAKVFFVVQLLKRVVTSCRNHASDGFCYVLTSIEDNLLRELELDRPSAFGCPGPRPCFCSGALNHRWREKRLCALLHSDMCACSTPTCDDTAVAVVFLRLPASAHSHVLQRKRDSGFPSRARHRTGAWPAGHAFSRALGDTQVATVECLQLGKAVYGLVNAPRVWCAKVNQVMARLGWIASSLEPCLWSLMSKHGRILGLCSVHVNGFWPHVARARVKLDRIVTHRNNSSGGQHGKTVTSSSVLCIVVKTLCTTGRV